MEVLYTKYFFVHEVIVARYERKRTIFFDVASHYSFCNNFIYLKINLEHKLFGGLKIRAHWLF